jgi:hypothetical protein
MIDEIEEYHFWSAAKKKFWIKVSMMIFAGIVLLFAAYGWILYQEKVQISDKNSDQHSNPPAALLNAGDIDSTNTSTSALSPLPMATNSN